MRRPRTTRATLPVITVFTALISASHAAAQPVVYEPGTYVWQSGENLVVQLGSPLIIAGEPGNPVIFDYSGSTANLIEIRPGAQAHIENLEFIGKPKARTFITVRSSAKLTILDSRLTMGPLGQFVSSATNLIDAELNSTVVLDHVEITDIIGQRSIESFDSTQTGPGGDVLVISAESAEYVGITNTRFDNIRGGEGGQGEQGTSGGVGDAVPDAVIGNGLTGNQGKTGNQGDDGERGGNVTLIALDRVLDADISQNIFSFALGGPGGRGGRGGNGGTGSQGGDGADGFSGGNGGRGGRGGTGGTGGTGGQGGTAIAIDAFWARQDVFITNNVAFEVAAGAAGPGGPGGTGGSGGAGGAGGDGVFDDGSAGSQGSPGASGSGGASGTTNIDSLFADIELRRISSPLPSVRLNNNLMVSVAPQRYGFIAQQSSNGVSFNADNNIISGTFQRFFVNNGAFFPQNTILAAPQFVDVAGGDFRLTPGSPGIDAGITAALSPLITTDFNGNPRYLDDPSASFAGAQPSNPGVPIDFGPFESPGNPCLADINGNGRVTTLDTENLITQIETGTGDINTDGAANVFDLLTYLEIFDRNECD